MTTTCPRRHRPTLVLPSLLAALCALVGAVATPVPAWAADGAAAELTSLVDAERAAAGLPSLQVAGDLVDVATRHAEAMASANELHHNPDLTTEVANWQRLTENVGRGPDARTIHDALMASPGHAANIRDADVSQVGVGLARSGDTLWVTQVFRQPETAPAPPPPPTPPAPTPAPAAPPPVEAPVPPATPSPAPPAPAPPIDDPVPSSRDDGGLLVDPADAGAVRSAPSPNATRLLATARWVAVVWLLVG